MKKTKTKTKLPTYTVPIMCIETGQRWNSKTEAALDLGVSKSVINDHMRFGEPIRGLHFERINQRKWL